jgi:hypothetical protein
MYLSRPSSNSDVCEATGAAATSTQSRRRLQAPRTRDEAVPAAFTSGRKRKSVLPCIAFPSVFGLLVIRALL